MENPIKMDDLGVPLFLEASKWSDNDYTPEVLLTASLPLTQMVGKEGRLQSIYFPIGFWW